jgi:hypothetical protein
LREIAAPLMLWELMRRMQLVVVVLALAMSAHAAMHRATWVWDNEAITTPEQRAALLDFCAARQIDAVFLHAPAAHLRDRADEFRAFLRAAHARGVRVEALGGASDWARDRGKPRKFVATLLDFQRAGAPEERFDALHLDVEPYSTPEWEASREQAAEDWLALFDEVRAAAGGLPLAADIPPWLGRVQTAGGDLLSGIIARVDEVGLMAYSQQRKKKQLVAACRPAMEAAARHGRSVWVGISVQPDYLISRKPRSEAERLIKDAERAVRNLPALQGVAVHDYEHLRALYPSGASR